MLGIAANDPPHYCIHSGLHISFFFIHIHETCIIHADLFATYSTCMPLHRIYVKYLVCLCLDGPRFLSSRPSIDTEQQTCDRSVWYSYSSFAPCHVPRYYNATFRNLLSHHIMHTMIQFPCSSTSAHPPDTAVVPATGYQVSNFRVLWCGGVRHLVLRSHGKRCSMQWLHRPSSCPC